MATVAEITGLQRQILQKLYYMGQPVVSNPELRAIIDEQIEAMLTTLNGTLDILTVPVDVDSGSEIVIPGVAGYKIRVIQSSLTATGDAVFTYYSDTIAISGDYSVNTSKTHDLAPAQWGWFETDSGEDLIINKTGDGELGGVIGYVLIEADPVS